MDLIFSSKTGTTTGWLNVDYDYLKYFTRRKSTHKAKLNRTLRIYIEFVWVNIETVFVWLKYIHFAVFVWINIETVFFC